MKSKLIICLLLLCLSGCGGGGGGQSGGYAIRVNVSGLNGTGLVLQNSARDNLAISANGDYSFTKPLPSGEVFLVSVLAQPTSPAQKCVVSNGNGIVPSNDVNVTLVCRDVSRFAYITSPGSVGNCSPSLGCNSLIPGSIQGFVVDPSDGTLVRNGAPLSTESPTGSVIAHPSGKFLYVLTRDGVYGFVINRATGILSRMSASFLTSELPYFFAIDPAGKFAYVIDSSDNLIRSYSINPTTGVLTRTGASSVTPPYSLGFMAMDPLGRFVYVGSADGTISAYRINPGTGALASAGTVKVPVSPATSIAVDPSGKFVYVVNGISIVGYEVNPTSGLTEAGLIFRLVELTDAVAVDPTGRFVYGADLTYQSVSVYTVNPATGALTRIAREFDVGCGGRSMDIDSSGTFLYGGGAYLSGGCSIHPATGLLTRIRPTYAGDNFVFVN